MNVDSRIPSLMSVKLYSSPVINSTSADEFPAHVISLVDGREADHQNINKLDEIGF